MPRPFLSVVIPAWNEAQRLPLTLIDIDRHLSAQDFTSEIIVALSPSSDNSAEILARLGLIIKNLKTVQLIENQGKGFALREGMKAARGSYRLSMDADNSVPLIEVMKMLPYMTREDGPKADLVIGSRIVQGGAMLPRPSLLRRLSFLCSRIFIRLFLVRSIGDTSCGFKCFTAQAADAIFPETRSHGHAIETELVFLAQKRKLRIQEIPVSWAHDPESASRNLWGSIREHCSLLGRLLDRTA